MGTQLSHEVSTKRLFIALALPAAAKAELNSLVHALRRSTSDVRWVRSEHVHITMKFLGDVEESRIDSIVQALARLHDESSFWFNLSTVGAFPDRENPRVIWTGLGKGRNEIVSLANTVERSMEGVGFPPEARSYSPHITIGRVKEPGNFKTLWQRVAATPFESNQIDAHEVLLIHSSLTKTGPIYTELESFSLRGLEKET
jgi:2'-5' RNA ligase